AILSAITPPVALAVFAAAGLAKADLWKSGWAAMKIGAAGFVVPFMFVYEPALLMFDPLVKSKDLITANWLDIARATATASLGIMLLAAGLHGFIWGRLDLWQRALACAGAACLILPTLVTDIAGVSAAAALFVSQKMLGRSGKDRPAAPPPPAEDEVATSSGGAPVASAAARGPLT
ncbi:MAG TPA: hypothetical protein PK264_14100, partial [Hyphomicrobiaceae bacterium]|nr:hypothetical protein [Hyphomicrobiaceae bacterium]